MPAPMVRIALINDTDKTVTLRIETGEDVGWFELGTDKVRKDPKDPDVFLKKQAKGTWKADLDPGHIYGFTTTTAAKVPEDASVTIYYANGKDPWPKPPPPPPPIFDPVDFNTRFEWFLLAASVDEREIPVHVTREPGEPATLVIAPGNARRTT